MANIIITQAQANKLREVLKRYTVEQVSDNFGTEDSYWDPLSPEWDGVPLDTLNRALYQPYDIAGFTLGQWIVQLEDKMTLEVLQDNIQFINENHTKYRKATLSEEREGKRRKQFIISGRKVDEYKRNDLIRIMDDADRYIFRIVKDVNLDGVVVDSDRVVETSIGEKVYFNNCILVCPVEKRLDMDIK
ncbi:hypothetical protein SAMN05421503_1494 [Terribacillus aidingensis]|uniref:Uncharacterized protein n=1 Tax=Terribacillus aidingensis TaxID=586416 RepID=A0A285NKP9_9BACI|nr:hypothetical protein [Terribacillus aidingensis]SNZ10039.1 hypothetical protein SAMN05421503_1494 [Terribacillus aidingensis]